jgi:ubiquinone/menaquinone biosynthesis C-methylase UbiE
VGAKTGPLRKTHQRKEDNRSPVWRQPCHAGRAKKGAIVTGVDLSSEQVRLARKAAKYIGVDIELVEADWQDLPRSISKNYFDLVATECGIFIWIRKLDAWMKNAWEVLGRWGGLIVSDFHPLSLITELKNGKVTFRKSYFDQSPEVCKPRENVPPSVESVWKLSDIINSAIQAGFRLDRVEEFYVDEPDGVPFIPNNFLLVATKESADELIESKRSARKLST